MLTDAEAETLILWPPNEKNWLIWKDPDARKDWRQEEEEKGTTDGWMASPTEWTWVWASSRSWWWTGKPGELQSMGSQRVGQDWATELNWAELHRSTQLNPFAPFCTEGSGNSDFKATFIFHLYFLIILPSGITPGHSLVPSFLWSSFPDGGQLCLIPRHQRDWLLHMALNKAVRVRSV